jgi:hypothetical protein
MPLRSQYMESPYPPQPPAPITQRLISTRIQNLLQSKLSHWQDAAIMMLSCKLVCTLRLFASTNTCPAYLSHVIISRDRAGLLGPDGISSVNEIFMVIGHEGTTKYMALAVTTPIDLHILFRGEAREAENRDPLEDGEYMEELRLAFYEVAVAQWQSVNAKILQIDGKQMS